MNNNGNVPPVRKRKQAIQLLKGIKFYLESQDGHDDIDSTLDEALDCLANVSVKMHDYWIRAVQERERMEREFALRDAALELARSRAIKLTANTVAQIKAEVRVRAYINTLSIDEVRELKAKLEK